MPRTLIRNATVVTVDGTRRVFPAGHVAIDGTRIASVGPADSAPAAANFDEVIDAAGCIVLPGLINMHQHHWYTLFKGGADGMLLEDWVTDYLLPLSLQLDENAYRLAAMVAGMEMLATGTTCSLNHSVATTSPALVKAQIEPQVALGIRHVFAKELRCNTPGNPHHPMSLDESTAVFEEEARRWDGHADGLVRVAMVIESAAHWVAAGMSTESLIVAGYQLARKLGLRIADHISGGTFSLEKGMLKYLRETGRTDTRYLMQLGVLDAHWILKHGIHATDLDIEQIARVGASLVYTPTSESIRGGGIAPFAHAHRAGVNIALGTDGPMVDYSVDMVEQMKVAMLMQHVRHLDPTRLGVEQVIEMATINAARALGMEAEIGSLEVGKRADIAVFDLRRPHVGVLHRPISSFVCAAKGTDARMVLVNGVIVYRDGHFPRVADSQAICLEAERLGRSLAERAGVAHRFVPAWRST
ncbi:MAG: amidohydrolase family protein [Burkholderiales bacterium]